MKSKKIMALLLAIAMILPMFSDIAYAAAAHETTPITESEMKGQVKGKKKIFTIDKDLVEESAQNTKKVRGDEEVTEFGLFISPEEVPERVGAGENNTTVTLTTHGIAENAFDWSVFAKSKFTVKFTYTDENGTTKEIPDGEMTFTKDGEMEANVGWPVIEGAQAFQLVTEFDGNYDVRAKYDAPNSNPESGILKFELDVYELPNTNISVEYKDIYGIDLSKNLPEETDTVPNFHIGLGEGVDLPLPKTNKSFNIRNWDDVADKLSEEAADGILDNGVVDTSVLNAVGTLPITINNLTEGSYTFGNGDAAKGYKYKIEQKSKVDQTVISMIYQADVAVPPDKGDGTPVDVPDGYVRLTFDANEAGENGLKGKFADGSQVKYIDIKGMLTWDETLKGKVNTELKKFGNPQALKEDSNVDDTKNFVGWLPKIGDQNGTVETKSFNAKYSDDVVPQTGEDKPNVPNNFVLVTFDKGAHGDFADGVVTKYWVNPEKEVEVPAPTVNAAEGYVHTGWTGLPTSGTVAEDLKSVTGTFAGATTVTAKFVALDEIVGPKDPTTDDGKNPDAEKYWTVTFVSEDETKGTVAAENTFYVLKTAGKTLADLKDSAPAATPVGNHKFTAWDPALDDKTAIDQNLTVTAKFVALPEDKASVDYPNVNIDKGDTETVTPTITDKDGNKVDPDKIVITDEPGNGIVVTPHEDGTITITVPEDYDGPKDVTIDVTVTVGGKDFDETINVTIKDNNEPPQDNKSDKPIVDPVKPGDTEITGEGKPGAEIEVILPNGDRETTVVDQDGNWEITIDPAEDGDDYYVTQIEPGKDPSDEVHVHINGDHNHHDGDNTIKLHWTAPAYKPVVEEKIEIDGRHNSYLNGYPDGTVKPDGFITRAESAQIIATLKGLSMNDIAEPNFTDTPSGWYNKAINAVVSAGLMKGYPDGTFKPNEKITRAEFAQMIKSIDNANSSVAPFEDVRGHWAENAINQAYGNGRIKGYPDGTFKPNASITRAEAVTIANSLFDRKLDGQGLVEKLKNPSAIKTYSDLNASHWGYYEILEASNTHDYQRRVKGEVIENWIEVR